MAIAPHDWALVAHELGASLAPVRNAVDLLRRGATGDLTPRAGQMLGIASRGLERADRVLQNLAALAAPTPPRLHLESFEAQPFLERLREDFAIEADVRGIRLVVDADARLSCIADLACLEQLIANLISNALKFTPEGGHVTLRARRAAVLPGRLVLLGGGFGLRPSFLALEVLDTGMGVSEEARRRLFEPFFRAAEAEARAIPGSGLGLAVARRLAMLLRADLRLVAAPEAGACLRLVLAADTPTWDLVGRVDAALEEMGPRVLRRQETMMVLRRDSGWMGTRPETLSAMLQRALDEPETIVLELAPTTWTLATPAPVRRLCAALDVVLPADPDWRRGLRLHAQRARQGSRADEKLLQGLVRCRHALPMQRRRREEVAHVAHPARG
jgi:hypothetical protein